LGLPTLDQSACNLSRGQIALIGSCGWHNLPPARGTTGAENFCGLSLGCGRSAKWGNVSIYVRHFLSWRNSLLTSDDIKIRLTDWFSGVLTELVGRSVSAYGMMRYLCLLRWTLHRNLPGDELHG
jgi:hypothetical protein